MSILASLVAEFVSYYKAILSRSMFSMHALVAVWRTTVIMGVVYWSLAMGVVMLVIEYFVTMWVRMGEEWPWISPSTLCYLITAAAALWVQKLESLGHIQGENGTYIATLPSTGMKMDFSAADWLLLTEQTMMVTIILSRWLLPKGAMTHKDLSALLLLYLALSADILDFSTIFNEATVVRDKTFCYVILVVWTGSLVQFTLVLTNTASVDKEDTRITLKSIVCSSEIWQILVQIGLQDMPFLLVRIIALLQYQVFNFTIIFFVCKNSLVICLELYHLVATCVEQQRKLKKRKERMKHLKSKMASVKKVVGLSKLGGITKALKAANNGGGGDGGDNTNDKSKSIGSDSGLGNNQNNTLSLIAAKLSRPKLEGDEGLDMEGKKIENGNETGIAAKEDKVQGVAVPNKGFGFLLKKNKENGSVLNAKSLVSNGSANGGNEEKRVKTVSPNLLLAALQTDTRGGETREMNVTPDENESLNKNKTMLKFTPINKPRRLISFTDGKENGSTESAVENDTLRQQEQEKGEKWVSPNLLFSTSKNGPSSEENTVNTVATTTTTTTMSDDDDDEARTGSQLAKLNNNWLNDDEDQPFWKVDPPFQNEAPEVLGRQNTIASIPPLSHTRPFQTARQESPDGAEGSPVLNLKVGGGGGGGSSGGSGRIQSRETKTRQSIFDDDDSVF